MQSGWMTRRGRDVADDDRSVRLDACSEGAHRAVIKTAAVNWPIPADRRLDQQEAVALREVGAGEIVNPGWSDGQGQLNECSHDL